MRFSAYKDNLVYSSQANIPYPRSNSEGREGFGVMIFLLTPNQDKAIEFINDEDVHLNQSLIKRYISDTIFRDKIGNVRLANVENMETDAKFLKLKNFKLMYVPAASREGFIRKKYSVLNDLSRWMELFFNNAYDLPIKKKCEEFARIVSSITNRKDYDGYEKILNIDLSSWVSSIKSCVIMNPRLINNPLSMIFYICNVYPELMDNFKGIRLMLTNRTNSSNEVYLIKMEDITKKNYPKIKAKISRLTSLIVFSADDTVDTGDSNIDAEVKAELIEDAKNEVKTKVKDELLPQSTNTNFVDIFNDITEDSSEPLDDDIFKELDRDISQLNAIKDDTGETLPQPDSMEDEISKLVEEEFDGDIDDENINVDEIADKVTSTLQSSRLHSSFLPSYSEAELERINRLTDKQNSVLYKPTVDDIQRKSIPTSVTGGYIDTTNPNILTSKYINFDQAYNEKCLEMNIDNAVGIMAKASSKIFVTNKEVKDSSTPMDLKKTYTYSLEDEKGNKSTIKFDIPTIIDGSYVYLNGTKKCIKHQFILKPLVKTEPNTVQLVTAYNKVFITRDGLTSQNMSKIITHLTKNIDKFGVKEGNCSMQNTEYDIPLELGMLSRYITEFKIGNITYYVAIDKLLDKYRKAHKSEPSYNKAKELPIGFDNKTKKLVTLPLSTPYMDYIYNQFDEADKASIKRINRKPKLVCANAKMMNRLIPLVLFMMYCEGFSSVMKKANIKYEFITKDKLKDVDKMLNDTIELEDGYIVWSKVPFRNEILMNGLKKCDMTSIPYEGLESKDEFISLIMRFFPGNSKINVALDNYKDFLLDDKAKEILADFGYPTDLVEVLVVAAGMLCDNHYRIENDMHNMRIRSNEVIPDLVYLAVTKAYTDHRQTAYKKKPKKISIKQSHIIDTLLSSSTNMIEEYSTLNPVLEIEKQRAVTFKGLRGIQKNRAMTLPRRAYNQTMLGTVGISTSPDANVGIIRELTLEPNITSTYGYIDAEKPNDLNKLNSANLFTVAELVQPFGVIHDDPDRTAMSYKQTKYMIPVKDSDPVLVGNKVEAVVPYLLSDEFVVSAKEDGKVISIENDYCVIEYKSGKKLAIDLSERVRKNSSAGFWIDNTLKCDLSVGDKFKEGDILAYNDKHFTPNANDNGVSMNLGVLCKIAISSQWDVFEDSMPISKRISEKQATEMVDEKAITLSPYTFIEKIAKVGDKIAAGDPLLIFSDAETDEYQKLFDAMREENREALLENAKTTISSKYTGTIADIKIYSTLPTEELHPSMQKVLKAYHSKIKARNKTLKTYSNEGDQDYYKAGQIIYETDEPIQVGKNMKIKGHAMEEDGMLILFYIKYDVEASKGDKLTVSVCKGIVSHVFEEGMEPYSDYRPDEPIDTIVAPLAVAARKVPAIFLSMFSNKLVIELKRQLKDIYLGK